MSARFVNARCNVLGPVVLLALASTAGAAPVQTPDVIVYDVGVNGGDPNDIHYYGQFGGIAAYSIATQSCNSGTGELDWYTGGSTLHPVIAQNMFRLKGGRFEQLGQSWLKHGFCAVNEIEVLCAPCQSTPCDTLGIGCADTYWATLNDGASGQSKVQVNAATGSHVHAGGPTGNATIRGRLQVAVADIDPAQNPGAEYFIEGQYVTADDALAGVSANNASWRRVNVLSVSNVDGNGPTNREQPAIFAWADADPLVEIKGLQAADSGVLYLAYRVTDLGNGLWHYEYALQNLNSDQSAASLTVPVQPSATVTGIGFRDVAYHSGDPYDGTDWPGVRSGGEIRWATAPFLTNPNANALRWGTLYNFRFDADAPPARKDVTIGFFKTARRMIGVAESVLVPMGIEPSQRHTSQSGRPAAR